MKIMEDGTYDSELQIAVWNVANYEKLHNKASKLGFTIMSDVLSFLHNERAYWINKIEQGSDYALLCKIWKDGSVHIYDRQSYLDHRYGKKRRHR